ncbi:FeoB-associated Cys-rich membrane protein [Sphingobacterium humi]|uniref:FeoB-associated Cys-rich membrane protein n=1 Tax=Sphingobacterium humi TaxID=1796905 RepID=UPI003CCD6CBA
MDTDPNSLHDWPSLFGSLHRIPTFKIMETGLLIQYIIIFILFVGAVYFVVRSFIPNKNKPKAGCGKGCGCDVDLSPKK